VIVRYFPGWFVTRGPSFPLASAPPQRHHPPPPLPAAGADQGTACVPHATVAFGLHYVEETREYFCVPDASQYAAADVKRIRISDEGPD
jgi:hypothetical protein